MPFGRKTDAAGRVTNFDSVYEKLIAPAVEAAGLEPIRADEEKIGGTIHKPMFERLMLCHYAVADITGANPNVFYELGIRHALRPRSTVILFVEGTVIPFDIALVRGIAYRTDGAGEPVDAQAPIAGDHASSCAPRARTRTDDSPIFQLLDDLPHTADRPQPRPTCFASRSTIPRSTRPGSPPRCARAPRRCKRSRPSRRSTISTRSRPAWWSMSFSRCATSRPMPR